MLKILTVIIVLGFPNLRLYKQFRNYYNFRPRIHVNANFKVDTAFNLRACI